MHDSPELSESDVSKRQQAIGIAAETMGELVEFWGFKASMGRIWTILYLCTTPLPADEIAERTQLSAGAVSMTLAELMQWGLVVRVPMPNQRKRFYTADTDVWVKSSNDRVPLSPRFKQKLSASRRSSGC